MKLPLHDWSLALLWAVGLLACAAGILFLIQPGGFEGQVGWFFALMPGAILGLSLADSVYKIAPAAEGFALWGTTIAISLLWYFAIAYVGIKIYRLIGRAL